MPSSEAAAGEAAVEALVPVGGVPRVFRREVLAEARVVGQLLDAAPERGTLPGPEALADLGEVEREGRGGGRDVVHRLGTDGRKAHSVSLSSVRRLSGGRCRRR